MSDGQASADLSAHLRHRIITSNPSTSLDHLIRSHNHVISRSSPRNPIETGQETFRYRHIVDMSGQIFTKPMRSISQQDDCTVSTSRSPHTLPSILSEFELKVKLTSVPFFSFDSSVTSTYQSKRRVLTTVFNSSDSI
jgi:hypothetical protein